MKNNYFILCAIRREIAKQTVLIGNIKDELKELNKRLEKTNIYSEAETVQMINRLLDLFEVDREHQAVKDLLGQLKGL